jgi:hypothetical protein
MMIRSRVAIVFAVASMPLSVASAAPPTYVVTFDNMVASVTDFQNGPGGDSAFYNSGNLQQLSDTYSDTVSVDGFIGKFDQHAGGAITSTAEVGSLHALVTADANTDNYFYGGFSQATATSQSKSYTAWFDTVTFFTNNPNGSLFTAEIALDDVIVNTADQTDAAGFSANSSVRAALDIQGLSVVVIHPVIYIDDQEILNNSGTIINPPDSFVRNYTFHVFSGTTLTFLESLDITSNAVGGDTKSVMDVEHTARFALYSADSGASYSSASGVVFDTTTAPEPSALGLLLAGSVVAGVGRRK